MKVIDWEKHVGKWTHLKGIQFPDPGKRPIVDLLIEVDFADLHYSFKENQKPDLHQRNGYAQGR